MPKNVSKYCFLPSPIHFVPYTELKLNENLILTIKILYDFSAAQQTQIQPSLSVHQRVTIVDPVQESVSQ